MVFGTRQKVVCLGFFGFITSFQSFTKDRIMFRTSYNSDYAGITCLNSVKYDDLKKKTTFEQWISIERLSWIMQVFSKWPKRKESFPVTFN